MERKDFNQHQLYEEDYKYGQHLLETLLNLQCIKSNIEKNQTAAGLKLDLSCVNVSTWARKASSSQASWSRAPPMGQECQLHHIIIHSKPVMKSPSSSTPIRKNGSLKKWRGRGREKWKWIKSTKIFGMIVERVLQPLSRCSHGFSIIDRNDVM